MSYPPIEDYRTTLCSVVDREAGLPEAALTFVHRTLEEDRRPLSSAYSTV